MNNYCINCGKSGHSLKHCSEPITSCGIICFKIDNLPITKIQKYLINKCINIEDFNYNHLNYYNKINFHNNNIKFLLIQRKQSLSYIEFIRGKYNELDINKIKSIFELMTKKEVDIIKNNTFDYLWNKLWSGSALTKKFLKEKENSKNKFIYLKNNGIINNLQSNYDEPEWGFPKGRRNKFETNKECAIREFIEETNNINYKLLNRINPIEEIFNGTDQQNYKHVYYIAGTDDIVLNYIDNNYEVGNIGWFTIDQVLKLLRPYNYTKINIINQIYFLLTIINEKINKRSNIYINPFLLKNSY